MSDPTTISTIFVTTCAEMLHHATHQRRTAVRALMLTIGLVLVTGRTMLSRVLIVLGMGSRDWTAMYRLFAIPRLDLRALRIEVIRAWLAHYEEGDPVVVVVDGTHLPRTGRKIPGVGFARSPRTPAWHPGIHLAQRWEGVSGLTPPTIDGDCRAIPLLFTPAPSPRARRWPQHPAWSEWEAALHGVHDVRLILDTVTEKQRPLVVVGDGAYSGAGIWTALPPATTWIARCPKNRALFELPDPTERPARGRKRLYGPRGLTPQAQGQERQGWQRCVIRVRGKDRHVRVHVTGPWILKLASSTPLMLVTIAGIDRHQGHVRQSRDMMHFLVNARATPAGWVLPFHVTEIVGWVWQRWEVEVMHRELKSGWGLGDQQQWSGTAASTIVQWVVWAYAVLILAGMSAPPPARMTTHWYRARRWTPRDLTLQLREELWTLPPRQFTRLSPGSRTIPPQFTALRVLLAVADAI